MLNTSNMVRFSGKAVMAVALLAGACAHAAEQNEVEKAAAAWIAAINDGDNEAGRNGFADDAVIVSAAGPVAVGRAEVDANVKYLTATPGFHIDFQPERSSISTDGRTGFVVGASAINVPAPGGGRITTRQRLLLVWRKDSSGVWKCIYNVPMGGEPSK